MKPILDEKKAKQKIYEFTCDKCGSSLTIDLEETEAPIWATYNCSCGRWTQYGSWNGRENIWEYKPNQKE